MRTTFKDLSVNATFRVVDRPAPINYVYQKVQRSDPYNAKVAGQGLYCVISDDTVVEVEGDAP